MKKLIFSVALLSAALSASAEDHPLWMRYPAISPDGTTIAFAYKGDLYSVSVNGGEARQLTTHAAFDSHPVWSPDSKKIAFQSNREGSLDIFVIDAKAVLLPDSPPTAAAKYLLPLQTTTMCSTQPVCSLQPRASSSATTHSHKYIR